jgi:two-component system, NarL family, nitrate/nitrite response regulator NarL
VLVVDDRAEARAAIEDAVGHARGFEVVGSVSSGEEALDVLHRVDPALVLLDVRMPGLSGPETCRSIRASGARAVVVLVSAHRRPELPDSVDTCGAAAVLYKGDVSPRRLEALWRSVQSQRSGAAALTK